MFIFPSPAPIISLIGYSDRTDIAVGDSFLIYPASGFRVLG